MLKITSLGRGVEMKIVSVQCYRYKNIAEIQAEGIYDTKDVINPRALISTN